MRQTLLLIAAVALVGCGKKDSGPPGAKVEFSGDTVSADNDSLSEIGDSQIKPEPTPAEKAAA